MDRKERSYTVLLVPGHNSGKTLSFHCSRFTLIVLAVLGAVILLLAGFATVASFDALRKERLLAGLRADNEALTKENGRVRLLAQKIGKLDTLAAYLQGLAEITPSSRSAHGADTPSAAASSLGVGDSMQAMENTPIVEDSLPTTPPVRGWVTQKFSIDTVRRGIAHPGIDIAASEGTPIVAAAPGTVVDVAATRFYGNLVTIDHGNGYITRYGHCLKVFVKKGQRVDRGGTIAQVGNTGFSSAPHLHYEVIKNGKNINPLGFIVAGKK
jgi:murein DD-endopeptidase MepM/ murein hydrolase activator NlpD